MTNNHDSGAVNGLPENFEELKRAANRSSSWRDRLNAVNELGNWDTEPTIKLLQNVLKNDQVFQVREAAYLKLKQLGEEVQMPAKNKGELFKGTNKILLRIKKAFPKVTHLRNSRKNCKKHVWISMILTRATKMLSSTPGSMVFGRH